MNTNLYTNGLLKEHKELIADDHVLLIQYISRMTTALESIYVHKTIRKIIIAREGEEPKPNFLLPVPSAHGKECWFIKTYICQS